MPRMDGLFHFAAGTDRPQMAFGYRKMLRARKWYSIAEMPKPCERGFHASERVIDALQYAQGNWFSVVSLDGVIVPHNGDKLCAQKRLHHKFINAEMVLHEFACWCAEQALKAERKVGREPHPDSWKAIKVKRQWVKGKATNEQMAAAGDAAWAAGDAAWAAGDAAAWAAAGAAARAAVWAAGDAAAGAAARDAQNDKLTALLMEVYENA